MPAKGKHRLSTSRRIARVAAVASAGGAAIALPLMGATGAQAATSGGTADVQTYTVKAGDTLSKIAKAQHVEGGWKKLYEDNKDTVGPDADRIEIGAKLTIGGASEASAKGTADATQTSAKSATTASGDYVAPVDGAQGHGYGNSGSMWSSGSHTGADFSVPTGTAVKAITDGTVVSAGDGGAYGNQVVIEHADGHFSQYAHLSSIAVAQGDKVTAGQEIGKSGATGNVTGPHLHFEVRTTADYGSDIDPIAYLSEHGVSA
ncbi:LysM peptidoglycan-binding domain-containing M23 family metallopeptidase [Streptomyces sp. NPDC006422]|uniref:M23 family metallopeptidase n=1 Tax=unclassified Streptomyces TaxID=2593676 RepID=UPI0033B80DBD